ncbi:zinc-finger of the MIZ type in Nse subunit-domain-containing protein [Aspergillus welwitschiae]|uniref:Zinc-finger of the MIZ type in Nse subunit-domain-containing protein n=1 Tax=Aspergillus welwitschiae TaxID=1341132 RepID=A0A3F3QBW0_9EURO|nr:zinc-finger of the MIZ type in Nse subunit-domain-containing protein [Aspergillus welwitschiae]RDH36549.1 zinc-finger of the MIZ type in Nse subunit-domain-containing protein [Aspergillus welwitschiae]
MPKRSRPPPPTATPGPSGRNRNRDRDTTPPLPPYQPPTSTLTTLSHQPTTAPALSALLATHTSSTLKTHLQHAQEKLTDAAGEINERLTDAKERSKKSRERRRNLRSHTLENNNNGDGVDEEGGDSEDEGIEEFEERVAQTTKVLEETIRGVIDAEVRGEELGRVISGLEGGVAERVRVRGVRRSQRGIGRRLRGHHGEDEEDEEEEGEDVDVDEDEEGAVPFLAQFEDELRGKMEEYEGLSLTRRYSTNNSYIGFYKIIHEAKHIGDEIPPPPHPSTWFAHLEDPHSQSQPQSHPSTSTSASTTTATRQTRPTRARPQPPSEEEEDDDDDDEIAIQTERISLKCPLTLLPFRDPVTSTKCPHSFEREAIFTMISGSNQMVPDPRGSSGSGRAKRVRSVKCPVCEVQLTEFDLRSDPVLVRRVKRAEMAELRRREREMLDDGEDDQDGGDGGGGGGKRKRSGRRRGSAVEVDDGDSDDDSGEDDGVERIRVKRERGMSVAARIKQERAVSMVGVGDGDVEEVDMDEEGGGEEGGYDSMYDE